MTFEKPKVASLQEMTLEPRTYTQAFLRCYFAQENSEISKPKVKSFALPLHKSVELPVKTDPLRDKKEVPKGPKKLKVVSPQEEHIRAIKSDLNKLTLDNEETVLPRVCLSIEKCSKDDFSKIVPFILDKCIGDQKFLDLYIRLCVKLSSPKGIEFSLKEEIIKYIKDEFLSISESSIANRSKVITFTAALMQVQLIDISTVIDCIEVLFRVDEDEMGNRLYHIAEFLLQIVPSIQAKNIRLKFKPFFDKLKLLIKGGSIPNRTLFKVQDAIAVEKM